MRTVPLDEPITYCSDNFAERMQEMLAWAQGGVDPTMDLFFPDEASFKRAFRFYADQYLATLDAPGQCIEITTADWVKGMRGD